MGNWRARHPSHTTGWGNTHQLEHANSLGPMPGGGLFRFLLVLLPFALLGGCARIISGEPYPNEGLEPASMIVYDESRPGYVWAPGDDEWQPEDELDWDATVPSSYPTPLPTDVTVLPE